MCIYTIAHDLLVALSTWSQSEKPSRSSAPAFSCSSATLLWRCLIRDDQNSNMRVKDFTVSFASANAFRNRSVLSLASSGLRSEIARNASVGKRCRLGA